MKYDLKKIFLIGLIVSLSLTALIAIGIFIGGKFGKTEGRVLTSTLAVGIYSLTGLCNSVLLNKQKGAVLALFGIVISLIAFFVNIATIWEMQGLEATWKPCLSLLILSVASGHASLLLATCPSAKPLATVSLYSTMVFIGIVAGMLLYLILQSNFIHMEEGFYRALGVFSVLNVLGTIVTPILKKINT
jgi:hypothetical protein